MNYVLDSLTQIIARPFILEIAKKLIEDNIPYTLMILDLDNFKQINDTYGHLTGDYILKSVSQGILELCGKNVYVGRFGGDEFLLLIPNLTDYDDTHTFLEKLYGKGIVFRRYYNDGGRDIYVTATLGCAKFPSDGKTFDDLFNMADKALYRGKIKGRNCYIIYVESKHGNIVVQEKAEGSLVKRFNGVKRIFDIYRSSEDKIKHLVDYLYTDLHCTASYFLLPNKKVISNFTSKPKTTFLILEPHLEILLNGDKIFYDTPLTKYKESDPIFAKYVNDNLIHSMIVAKVNVGLRDYGYIILYESTITRVWQESEITLVMYASSLLEFELKDYK